MTPKEIGREAGRLFQATVPSCCAIRTQEDQEDYGIDYELELTNEHDHATGFIFKVQQKGTENTPDSASSEHITCSGLKTERLRYYLELLSIPVILVAVNVNTKHVCWVQLQGNPEVERALAEAVRKNNATLTLHVPLAQSLPGTFGKLLTAVNASSDWLVLRQLKSMSSRRVLLAASLPGNSDSDTASRLREHADPLIAHELELLIQQGRVVDAYARAKQLLLSNTESTSLRVAAGYMLIKCEAQICSLQPNSLRASNLTNFVLTVSSRMLHTVRPRQSPVRARVFVRVFARIARLQWYTNKDFGIYMSRVVQKQSGNEWTSAITYGAQAATTRSIAHQIAQLPRSLNRLNSAGHPDLLPVVWPSVVATLAVFVQRLYNDGHADWADNLLSWMNSAAATSTHSAEALGMWHEYASSVLMSLRLAKPNDSESLRKARDAAAQKLCIIPDGSDRADALKQLETDFENLSRDERPMTIEDEQRLYRSMAEGLGIDLNDPNDDIAKIVNVGLQDLSPERVVKNCVHLFVSLGPCGVPAQMLGLPTAGSKWVHCTKHKYAIMGLKLDTIYPMFAERHCAKCSDCKPHAAEWRWSREWQMQQDVLHGAQAREVNKLM